MILVDIDFEKKTVSMVTRYPKKGGVLKKNYFFVSIALKFKWLRCFFLRITKSGAIC